MTSLIHDRMAFHNVEELEPVPDLAGLHLQRFPAALRNSLGFKQYSRGCFLRSGPSAVRFVLLRTGDAFGFGGGYGGLDLQGDHAHSRYLLKVGLTTALFLEEPDHSSDPTH